MSSSAVKVLTAFMMRRSDAASCGLSRLACTAALTTARAALPALGSPPP